MFPMRSVTGPATLHVAALPGMTSLLEPNEAMLSLFHQFSAWAAVAEVPALMRRLESCRRLRR